MINLIGSVVEEPKQLVESGQALKLNQADAALLMKALNSPATVNIRLKAAASRYESKAQ